MNPRQQLLIIGQRNWLARSISVNPVAIDALCKSRVYNNQAEVALHARSSAMVRTWLADMAHGRLRYSTRRDQWYANGFPARQ